MFISRFMVNNFAGHDGANFICGLGGSDEGSAVDYNLVYGSGDLSGHHAHLFFTEENVLVTEVERNFWRESVLSWTLAMFSSGTLRSLAPSPPTAALCGLDGEEDHVGFYLDLN
ncbi:uncharacterized protein LOC116007619 isoform X2 [Ipomoea triloba]|uniref:uncharacterized protein LOC116007619 isoform X2 n=1 Tax=Ipomoea triloba TaxID=35885 RepID=UPI00125CFF9E|nr:uncharacterized protein LOC116007619 isoform X2 [Ipomoea triloba]